MLSPIKYDIQTTEPTAYSKFPLKGMSLRDYQKPRNFIFWDAEGNYICTSEFDEVKTWSWGLPDKVECTLTYPCKKQSNE